MIRFCLVVALILCALPSVGSETETPFAIKKMDGVTIEALETYINPRSHELSFNLGWYPWDPYYTGFGVSGGYSYYFNNKLAWEVVQATYTFSVEKALTAELADEYAVNPESIDRLKYVVTSNILWTPVYGKFILGSNVIQYFRLSLISGVGFVSTSFNNKWAIDLGVRAEIHVNPNFSWRIEARNALAITSGVKNYVVLGLGTGIYL